MPDRSDLAATTAPRTAGRAVFGRRTAFLPPAAWVGFVVAAIAVGLSATLSWVTLQERTTTNDQVRSTLDSLQLLEQLLSTAKDAESGQRGFLLTGDERYLAPYTSARAALPGQLAAARRLTLSGLEQQRRLDLAIQLVGEKLEELGQTVALLRLGKAEEALAIVRTDRGKDLMDRLRVTVAAMQLEERRVLAARQREGDDAAGFSFFAAGGSALVLLSLIVAGAWTTSRAFRARETEAWVRAALARFSVALQGDKRVQLIGEKALSVLAADAGAQAGAVYVQAPAGDYHRVAGLAVPTRDDAVRPGDGLLGQAARDARFLHLTDVPPGHLEIETSLGRSPARQLAIVPAAADGVVQGVVELAFAGGLGAAERDLLERAAPVLATALRAAKDRTKLEELLSETQSQAEELQTQQEELRVSNEELEEQSKALRESQGRLESSQAELEANNAQLETQALLLGQQKDTLSRSQDELAEKAADLERASRYKSEFLANMSHELRTPLNSTLILAKLLADNKEGNLSPDQVRYAETISGAGNDLLVLINDILDLSKIEAGKFELSPETVHLERGVESLRQVFDPVARQKGIAFTTTIEHDVPKSIVTDRQRCAQVLRNLVANALKFTDHGEVALRVSMADGSHVSFAVSDTGIGIAPEQQSLVFDAFRQASGGTNRKYGGTGLGLTISRDLAQLLGGDIALVSRLGEGSVFTLTLPLEMPVTPAGAEPPAPPKPAPPPPSPSAKGPARGDTPAAASARPSIDDDRERLRADERLILVIEDDPAFAAILRDLAHELHFQCVVAHSASEGVAAAIEFRPSGIVLDMNLPDHSGLGVLDQLKRNPQTRHIPVHVASVADYSQAALELGAVGYALKPVQRAELVNALRRLEEKFSQAMGRVLVVEDDARQRDAIGELLGGPHVEITTVESAGAALAALREKTFDCVVMDLNLPDLSGYALLEKMAGEDDVSFPPVIVYTGRNLTRDEEQQLRRFSRSIIVKGARSPERLLDEVTLFLHQVESDLPAESQRLLKAARHREALFEGRRILVVEDDVRNVFALSSVLEPKGARIDIARNGREGIEAIERTGVAGVAADGIDLVLMDIMMPEMDGLTAMREIRKRPEWRKLPIIALTAKAMKDDQEKCLDAGANDYIAKPLDVDKLLSLVRVWLPR